MEGYSQCKITAPAYICIGDPGIFGFQTPSGSTVQSVLWDFGNGFTSTTLNTGHLYSKPGVYRVKCSVKLTTGGACSDSVSVNVLNLPISKFYIKNADSCFNKK